MGWRGERIGLDPGSVAERKSERGMKQRAVPWGGQ